MILQGFIPIQLFSAMSDTNQDLLIDATEASMLIGCSRGNIERLQLKGLLQAVPTIHPKYYFKKDQVIELKKTITSKKVVL